MVNIPVTNGLVLLGAAGVASDGEAFNAVKAGGDVLFGTQKSAQDEAARAWDKACDNFRRAPFITTLKTGAAYMVLDGIRSEITKNGTRSKKLGPFTFR